GSTAVVQHLFQRLNIRRTAALAPTAESALRCPGPLWFSRNNQDALKHKTSTGQSLQVPFPAYHLQLFVRNLCTEFWPISHFSADVPSGEGRKQIRGTGSETDLLRSRLDRKSVV